MAFGGYPGLFEQLFGSFFYPTFSGLDASFSQEALRNMAAPKPDQSTILSEAAALVDGPRQQDYGSPKDNFKLISHMWGGYLYTRGAGKPMELSPEDIAMMMILVKVARHAATPKRDNLVDIAGYARCAELCMVNNEEKPGAP